MIDPHVQDQGCRFAFQPDQQVGDPFDPLRIAEQDEGIDNDYLSILHHRGTNELGGEAGIGAAGVGPDTGLIRVTEPRERLQPEGMRLFSRCVFVHLFDQGDVLDDVEVGEQGRLPADGGDALRRQSVVIALEGGGRLEEFYRDLSSNDSTSIKKIAIKSLTIPLSTEMGMSVMA